MIVKPTNTLQLDCYVDADFAGLYKCDPDGASPTSAKSRLGFIILLGGVPLVWRSQLQSEISLSTFESEYSSLSQADPSSLQESYVSSLSASITHQNEKYLPIFVKLRNACQRAKAFLNSRDRVEGAVGARQSNFARFLSSKYGTNNTMNKIDGGITGDSISSLTRESARGGDEEALLMMRSVVGAANDDAPSTTCTSARHAARTSNLVPNNELSNVSQIIENDIVSNNTDQSGSRALFDEIDAGINDIRNCSWKAKLRFPSYYCSPDEPLPYSNLYVASDLFELTQQVKGLAGMIARFDPSKYPVVAGGMKQNEQTWRKLSSDIMSESKNNGKLLLVSNGSWGSNEKKVLVCSRFRMYAEKARRPKAGGKLRARSINCDKRNARKGNGKSQKKRTSTSKALPGSDEPTCKAKLVIGIDSQSFFLVCGNGNDVHIGHLPLRSRFN
jgi:hypothetical protein